MKKKLMFLAALTGIAAVLVRKRAAGSSEWRGLTEAEARQKLNDRFPDVVPDDKREVVTEKIVSKMRDKGVIVDDVDLTDTVDLDATEPATPADDGITATT